MGSGYGINFQNLGFGIYFQNLGLGFGINFEHLGFRFGIGFENLRLGFGIHSHKIRDLLSRDPRLPTPATDSEFRTLISKCRLPTKVIKSLKLSLTRKKPFRRYQQLSHQYNENIVHIPEKSQTIETKNGHEISPTNVPDENFPTVQMDEKDKPNQENPDVIEISDDDDDFGMEGWEIHQSLQDRILLFL